MSDRRDTTDTTETNTYTHEEPVRGRQPVGGDHSASTTPPADSGVEMRDDQTHPRGTSAVGSDSRPQMASGSSGPLDQDRNDGGGGGFAGISMGLLWTVLILLIVAVVVIVFFAL